MSGGERVFKNILELVKNILEVSTEEELA